MSGYPAVFSILPRALTMQPSCLGSVVRLSSGEMVPALDTGLPAGSRAWAGPRAVTAAAPRRQLCGPQAPGPRDTAVGVSAGLGRPCPAMSRSRSALLRGLCGPAEGARASASPWPPTATQCLVPDNLGSAWNEEKDNVTQCFNILSPSEAICPSQFLL